MNPQTCLNCGVRVIPKKDRTCPSCSLEFVGTQVTRPILRSRRAIEFIRTLRSPTEGCSDSEVANVANAAGFRLPGEYETFLRVMGKNADFISDHDICIFHPDVIPLNDEFKHEQPQLFRNGEIFVFCEIPDSIMYFRKEDGDDPPIYCWSYTQHDKGEKAYDSIWHMLDTAKKQRWASW